MPETDTSDTRNTRHSRSSLRRTLRWMTGIAMAIVIGATGVRSSAGDWRTASREPVGLAPDAAVVTEAMVQVYGARAVGAKGLFGVHTWVAVKPTNAAEWTVYEVVGWRLRSTGNVVVARNRAPDGRWFGEMPELYAQKRGAGVDELIVRIEQAVQSYPHAHEYRPWPGPNSNTFTAWIGRAVPELEMDLPATAIGKDYLGSSIVATAPSGSGFQFSLGGVLGFAASEVDGIEFNVLGLNVGVSPNGLKLPLIGRVGSFTPGDAVEGLEEAVTAPLNDGAH